MSTVIVLLPIWEMSAKRFSGNVLYKIQEGDKLQPSKTGGVNIVFCMHISQPARYRYQSYERSSCKTC